MKLGLGGVVTAFLATAGAMGCSSAKAPPADGNMQMRLSANSAQPTYCKIVHSVVITTKGGQAPNFQSGVAGNRIEDGAGGYSVSCKVSGGTDFAITGLISGGSSAFSFNGSVTKGATGQGSIAEYDSVGQTNVANPTDEPCTFTVTPDPLQVAPGRIWATFSCPTVLDSSSPTSSTCAAAGEFVFENCAE